ncbi:hypothetical protein D917_02844, partial [Trichinella nativa]
MRLTLTLLVGTNSMHARLNWPRAGYCRLCRLAKNAPLLLLLFVTAMTVLQFDDHGRMPSIRLKAPCSEV